VKTIIASLVLLSSLAATPALSADAPSSWGTAVARMIASRQNYPRSAQIRGDEGITRVRITIQGDGKISQVELAASSGSAILDREAQSMISAIGKLPSPPAGLHTFLVPIVWRLN
jgi:TonB family C-terminal domain